MLRNSYHRLALTVTGCACLLLAPLAAADHHESGDHHGHDHAMADAPESEIPMATTPMLNVDGEQVTIEDVAGEHGTLVLFSCNACPWVKAWEDRIAEIGNTYPKKGVGVIVINSNDPERVAADGYEQMQARAKDKEFAFPYVVDATSDIARAFGAAKTPEAFLYDAAGALVYHGAIDDDAKRPEKVEAHFLRDALEALIAGQEVPMAKTKAMGCSIKFRPEA